MLTTNLFENKQSKNEYSIEVHPAVKSRQKIGYVYVLIISILPIFIIACEEDTKIETERVPSFSQRVQEIYAENQLPGGIIGILQNGELSQVESFGYADFEENLVPDEQTIFRIGSISKTFTTTLASLLVEQEKLSFTDSLSHYLKEIKAFQGYDEYAKGVRIGNLTTHTSGIIPRIQQYDGGPLVIARDSLLNRPELFEFRFLAGSQYEYSNIGIVLLAAVIDRIGSDQTCEERIRRDILIPLGMTSTDITRLLSQNKPQSKGYSNYENGSFSEIADLDLGGQAPAGQYYSNLEDMILYLKFIRSAFKENEIRLFENRDMIQSIFADQPAPGPYGIGFLTENISGRRAVGHSGSIFGYSAYLRYIPEEDIGMMIMVNTRFPLDKEMGRPLIEGLINGTLIIENQ